MNCVAATYTLFHKLCTNLCELSALNKLKKRNKLSIYATYFGTPPYKARRTWSTNEEIKGRPQFSYM